MCIIIYAKEHVKVPDATIRTAFKNNPDGAGLMWKPKDGPIEIRKGFFNVEELLKCFHNIPVECERAIHCRIATHGKVNVSCCHPFPIRENTRCMKEQATCTDAAVMHNGIIHMTSPSQGKQSSYSDTMLFASEVLYPIKNALGRHYIQELVEAGIGTSRMLIFREDGDTLVLGNWVKDGKLMFSNTSYKDYTTYSSYYGGPYYSDCGYYSGSTYKTVTKKPEAKKPETKAIPAQTAVQTPVQAPVQAPVQQKAEPEKLPVETAKVEEHRYTTISDLYDAMDEFQADRTDDELDVLMDILALKEENGEFDDEYGEIDFDMEREFIKNYKPEEEVK